MLRGEGRDHSEAWEVCCRMKPVPEELPEELKGKGQKPGSWGLEERSPHSRNVRIKWPSVGTPVERYKPGLKT